jgi:para-nitrobenzyl esterase
MSAQSKTGDVLVTTHGAVGGTREGAVQAFYGIPYASAPTGHLRFRAPQAPDPWRSELDCQVPGPICPQGPPSTKTRRPQSEDCLRVNVWTPDPNGNHPVLLYLPGGGFVSGDAASAFTNGARLAARGVVVAAVTYRLHALGFLDLDDESGPNMGLQDQVAALVWLRNNASMFGGDPERITIAGYSAGGNAVGSLLAAPSAQGMFRRAIIQDGSALLNLSRAATAAVADRFLSNLGVEKDDRAALEKAPLDTILKAADDARTEYGGLMPNGSGRQRHADRRKGLTWTPSTGTVLPASPLEAIRRGSAAAVDLLIGTNRDSMALVTNGMRDVTNTTVASYLGDHIGDGRSLDEILAIYRRDLVDPAEDDILAAVLTDLVLRVPAVVTAEAQVKHNAHVWLYEYCLPAPPGGKAVHGADTGLWFQKLPSGGPGDPALESLADSMSASLAAFATDGNPAVQGFAGWSPFSSDRRDTLLIDREITMASNPHAGRTDLWAATDLP